MQAGASLDKGIIAVTDDSIDDNHETIVIDASSANPVLTAGIAPVILAQHNVN